MSHFTPVSAAVGGLLIGLAASALLYFNGRVAGVSGVLGHALAPEDGERRWRLLFVAGLVAGGLILTLFNPGAFDAAAPAPLAAIALSGLLVGFGTRLGGGCTSGHGVCGIARLSARSIAATIVFMAAGGGTVFVVRHLLGGHA
jgi:uncharacterized membrane protein YedE/YeeE